MQRFDWRHQYDSVDEEFYGELTKVHNNEPSLTQAHHAKDADINEILRRFGVTDGAVPPVAIDPQYFGDFTSVPDFRESLDRTRIAVERFNALPADIRGRFRNDPLELWQFVNDPRNVEESIKLGLLKRDIPPKEPSEPPAST